MHRLILTTTAAALLATTAHASVVYQNDFSGADPLDDFVVNNNTNAAFSLNSTVGNAGPSLQGTDTSLTEFAEAQLDLDAASTFDTSLVGQETITFSFDMRVDSFATSQTFTGANPRVIIRDAGNAFFTVGIGRRAGYNGYSNQTRILLYAGTGSASATATDTDTIAGQGRAAIGFPAGTNGGTFDTDFDFGAYDAGTATNNDTNILTGTEDGSFLRFELTYFDGESTIDGLVTNLATGNTTSFTYGVAAPASFSSSATANDRLDFNLGSQSSAVVYFDNIRVAIVPEPGSLSLASLGGFMLLSRRRAGRA